MTSEDVVLGSPERLAIRVHETVLALAEMPLRLSPSMGRAQCLGHTDANDPSSPMATVYALRRAEVYARESPAWLDGVLREREIMRADDGEVEW